MLMETFDGKAFQKLANKRQIRLDTGRYDFISNGPELGFFRSGKWFDYCMLLTR